MWAALPPAIPTGRGDAANNSYFPAVVPCLGRGDAANRNFQAVPYSGRGDAGHDHDIRAVPYHGRGDKATERYFPGGRHVPNDGVSAPPPSTPKAGAGTTVSRPPSPMPKSSAAGSKSPRATLHTVL